MCARPAGKVRVLLAAMAVSIVVVEAPPAAAYPVPGRTELVNPSIDGQPHDDFTFTGVVTPDGRYVAFESASKRVIAGGTNGQRQVFVRDRLTGQVELISVSTDGEQGNGMSYAPQISDDGRYVGFASVASNLVPDDTNGRRDVFVRDRLTGTTERVSVAGDGVEGNGHSAAFAMSADGMRLAIATGATNLTAEGAPGVVVRDRRDGTNALVSAAFDGTPATGAFSAPAISADGKVVAFASTADNLVPGDTFGYNDVFAHDTTTGETERVSVAVDGAQAGGHSFGPVLSGDGRFVAFHSDADDLVPWDVNNSTDVFVRDRLLQRTERVSVASSGEQSVCVSQCLTGWNSGASISRDGRLVSFEAWGSNMVPDDTTEGPDVVVHDRATGATHLASVDADGEQVNFAAFGRLSADGRWIVFSTTIDLYVRDLGPANGVGGLSIEEGQGGLDVSGWARFAGPHRAAADDAVDDAGTVAEGLGLELTGASVTHRPETEDLLVRWDVRRFPRLTQPIPGTISQIRLYVRPMPGVVYGLELTAGGVRYEARATWTDPERVLDVAQSFGLYQCETVCTEVARLSGGIASAGNDVRLAVPIDALGGATALTELRAFSALGEQASGAVQVMDDVALPALGLPAPTVALGVAPPGTAADEVDFSTPADVSEGRFEGTVPAFQGEHDLWAQACLGSACGTDRIDAG